MVTPAALLGAWEQAAPLAPVVRAVALAWLLGPQAERNAIARLPVGARDVVLLRLRQSLYGNIIPCITVCPQCRVELELALPVSGLLEMAAAVGPTEHLLEHSGYRVSFRLADSTDLESISAIENRGDAVQSTLLTRCVLAADGPAGPVAPSELPPEVVDAMAEEMQRLDPLSVLWISLNCAVCGTSWRAIFDIAVVVWEEVDRSARALLSDVHRMALAYGWSEREILAMSPVRRRLYLDLVDA